jgi:signal transduction histidine kinase
MSETDTTFDVEISEQEHRRVEALYRYEILDTMAESKFDGLTRLASRICDAPVSLINLMDYSRQWTKSSFGMDMAGNDMPRQDTVCHYTIQDDEVLEIENLEEDERFSQKWYVRESPNLRYYAGAPLTTSDGYRIGSLCIMDWQKRKMTEQQREDLKIIAAEVISQLELKYREKKLQRLNRQKDKLIRTVSHDLRNPLIGIIGTAEILQEEYEDEELLELVEIIENSGNQMYATISELLDSGILEEDQQQLNDDLEDPRELLEKIRELFQFTIKQKHQQLILNVVNEPPEVNLDRHKFSRMIGNLVSNAIKFTPKEGMITLELDYEEGSNPRLITRVKDTGMGIPESYIPHLFSDNNEEIRRSGTQAESSYGMGLNIVKRIADLHDGEIKVESEEGKGTTFEIRLPAK